MQPRAHGPCSDRGGGFYFDGSGCAVSVRFGDGANVSVSNASFRSALY